MGCTYMREFATTITYTNTISAEDYNTLRESAGWPRIHSEQATAGIYGSALVVAAKDDDRTVGTARLIWDGGYAALIKDVLVLPEYQGRGIGSEMMNRIMSFLKSKLKPGFGIQIDLMAATDKEPFYEKLGFVSRPRDNRGAGMDLWITKK
jgi:GNAT superfamily N-acetyltransferase